VTKYMRNNIYTVTLLLCDILHVQINSISFWINDQTQVWNAILRSFEMYHVIFGKINLNEIVICLHRFFPDANITEFLELIHEIASKFRIQDFLVWIRWFSWQMKLHRIFQVSNISLRDVSMMNVSNFPQFLKRMWLKIPASNIVMWIREMFSDVNLDLTLYEVILEFWADGNREIRDLFSFPSGHMRDQIITFLRLKSDVNDHNHDHDHDHDHDYDHDHDPRIVGISTRDDDPSQVKVFVDL
jgi:hypothetical protein